MEDDDTVDLVVQIRERNEYKTNRIKSVLIVLDRSHSAWQCICASVKRYRDESDQDTKVNEKTVNRNPGTIGKDKKTAQKDIMTTTHKPNRTTT